MGWMIGLDDLLELASPDESQHGVVLILEQLVVALQPPVLVFQLPLLLVHGLDGVGKSVDFSLGEEELFLEIGNGVLLLVVLLVSSPPQRRSRLH